MSTPAVAPQSQRVPQLLGQTVVVIGGSAGIGLETAREFLKEGARVTKNRKILGDLSRSGGPPAPLLGSHPNTPAAATCDR